MKMIAYKLLFAFRILFAVCANLDNLYLSSL